MVDIFDFEDYRKFVLERVAATPEKGRGELTKIAKFLRAPLSTISLVFHGDRDLTPDQASDLCAYFRLGPIETDYFLCLVDYSRASSKSLRENLQRRMAELSGQSREVKNVLTPYKVLNADEKYIFYSDWCYSAVRLLTSTKTFTDAVEIAQTLHLPIERVHEILTFLLATGLCVESKGKLKMGPKSTHIGADDSLVFRHHRNWRELALAKHTRGEKLAPEEISVTYPCSISKSAMERIKKELLQTIKKVDQEKDKSTPEAVVYLNIDFFHLQKPE